LEKTNYKCALSGLPFLAEKCVQSRLSPYSPSIDRIEAGGDYTQNNCCVILFAMNAMLMDWGEDVFRKISNGYRHSGIKNRTKTRRT